MLINLNPPMKNFTASVCVAILARIIIYFVLTFYHEKKDTQQTVKIPEVATPVKDWVAQEYQDKG